MDELIQDIKDVEGLHDYNDVQASRRIYRIMSHSKTKERDRLAEAQVDISYLEALAQQLEHQIIFLKKLYKDAPNSLVDEINARLNAGRSIHDITECMDIFREEPPASLSAGQA